MVYVFSSGDMSFVSVSFVSVSFIQYLFLRMLCLLCLCISYLLQSHPVHATAMANSFSLLYLPSPMRRLV